MLELVDSRLYIRIVNPENNRKVFLDGRVRVAEPVVVARPARQVVERRGTLAVVGMPVDALLEYLTATARFDHAAVSRDDVSRASRVGTDLVLCHARKHGVRGDKCRHACSRSPHPFAYLRTSGLGMNECE